MIILSRLACLLALWAAAGVATGVAGGEPSGQQQLNVSTIRYPGPISDDDRRSAYVLSLLQLAVSYADRPYRLAPSTNALQARALTLVSQGDEMDIMWTMTTREREKFLEPIRIPLGKGLMGWRIALIHRDRQDDFHPQLTTPMLKQLLAGQMHDWPDTEILRANNYRVDSNASYPGMFKMLARGRLDYFPRSIMEVWGEAAIHRTKGIVVEQNVMLRYPAATYFFVSPKLPLLREHITRGLEAALADGSFDRLFYQYFSSLLQRARLERRRVIELHNPLLPPQTPVHRPELWLTVDGARAGNIIR